MPKDKEPLKLMPLDDLKRVIAGMLYAPKGQSEKTKPQQDRKKQ